jgi:hypothetical protein
MQLNQNFSIGKALPKNNQGPPDVKRRKEFENEGALVRPLEIKRRFVC